MITVMSLPGRVFAIGRSSPAYRREVVRIGHAPERPQDGPGSTGPPSAYAYKRMVVILSPDGSGLVRGTEFQRCNSRSSRCGRNRRNCLNREGISGVRSSIADSVAYCWAQRLHAQLPGSPAAGARGCADTFLDRSHAAEDVVRAPSSIGVSPVQKLSVQLSPAVSDTGRKWSR